jgi:hypothetical protein
VQHRERTWRGDVESAHSAFDIESAHDTHEIESAHGMCDIESAHGAGEITSVWCAALPKDEPPGGGEVKEDEGCWIGC